MESVLCSLYPFRKKIKIPGETMFPHTFHHKTWFCCRHVMFVWIFKLEFNSHKIIITKQALRNNKKNLKRGVKWVNPSWYSGLEFSLASLERRRKEGEKRREKTRREERTEQRKEEGREKKRRREAERGEMSGPWVIHSLSIRFVKGIGSNLKASADCLTRAALCLSIPLCWAAVWG